MAGEDAPGGNGADDESSWFPPMVADDSWVQPAPRRVRGTLGGCTVFDTTRALYVWEWPYYPQYYIPISDVAADFLQDEGVTQRLRRGAARLHGLRAGKETRPRAARLYAPDTGTSVAGHVRFEWDSLDSWLEEDEEIFVHPRNPYVRVDAIRSHRTVRIEVDGTVLAESRSPVLLFETGLPTRYYLDRTEVRSRYLLPSETRTACPYKGETSRYWSVQVGDGDRLDDLAWCYDFPKDAARPVSGLVAFYNEKVDIFLDGQHLPRPHTHFSD